MEVLEYTGRGVGSLREHQCAGALEIGVEGLILLLVDVNEGAVEERILHNHHLDTMLEALATEGSGLLSVESHGVDQICVGISLEELLELLNDFRFIFFLHTYL